MKHAVNKIASSVMALIVLFSTLSFSVDMHYCGNHLVDFSFYGKVEMCLMQNEKSVSANKCPMMDMKMACCSDVHLTKVGQDDLKISFDRISFDQQVFVTSFIYACSDLFEGYANELVLFKEYSPPPLLRDVQILDQTFLI